MKSLAVKIAIALVFNAITLWVASVLPGVRLGAGFLWAVIVFTAATLLVKPLVLALFRRRTQSSSRPRTWLVTKGATVLAGLVATVLILLLTGIFSHGFLINGPVGWISATVVIWLASFIYDFVDDGLEARAHQLLGGAASPGKP
ncbi:phage holin family protein [Paenarthrobacter sp. NPDC089989]|uniref:phage holin family protein n=1 Tax=unclassified Paenarthrobacter TaxID=2634190 RepID=UPI00380172A8